MKADIQAGRITLECEAGAERLPGLLAFASRQNQKRSFLFVSKVLGKHIPVRPRQMRQCYNELAHLCRRPGLDTFVIGMAETAVGLGAGIADSLAKMHPRVRVYYQHTTRYQLDHPEWFRLAESHSHAVDHIVYQPQTSLLDAIGGCRHLILVDDEITTGKTLFQLAQATIEKLPNLNNLTIATLVNWLPANAEQHFRQLPVPVQFKQLIKGCFSFEPNQAFKVNLPRNADVGICNIKARTDLGRLGISMPHTIAPSPAPDCRGPSVILGTGEHLYEPFLIAESLEKKHRDIVFQSTTRSPIMFGDCIERKIEYPLGANTVNYIYNLPRDRTMHVLCENHAHEKTDGLANNCYQEVDCERTTR